jgi:hypothetical protein
MYSAPSAPMLAKVPATMYRLLGQPAAPFLLALHYLTGCCVVDFGVEIYAAPSARVM